MNLEMLKTTTLKYYYQSLTDEINSLLISLDVTKCYKTNYENKLNLELTETVRNSYKEFIDNYNEKIFLINYLIGSKEILKKDIKKIIETRNETPEY